MRPRERKQLGSASFDDRHKHTRSVTRRAVKMSLNRLVILVRPAFDQETGEVLWEINLGSPVSGFPITYAVDGRQYVVASTGTRVEDLTPELRPSAGNNLFVFALPE